LIKEALKEKGIKISKIDREDLRHTAIKAVKENKEILKEASRRERQSEKTLKDFRRQIEQMVKPRFRT